MTNFRPSLHLAVVLCLSFTSIISCVQRKKSEKRSNVKDQASVALQMVTMIENGCATGGCHGGNDNGEMSFERLSSFATKTAGYHTCLVSRQCYSDLTQPAAALCWQCLTGAGGLNGNGGIYQAAIKTGIVKKIAVAARIPTDDPAYQHMLQMSMPPGGITKASTDISSDQDAFQNLAGWLTAEANNDFLNLRIVRPAADASAQDASAQDATCDQFSPVVAQNILEDFSMEGVSMHGCPTASWPEDAGNCLANVPASNWANTNAPGLTVKILRTLTGRPSSAYWTRTSPDGRYVATGNGRLEDLKIADRSISVSGTTIDPAFSPDNKSYMWPALVCPISPLNDGTLSAVGADVVASGCKQQDVGVYASMATDSNGDTLMLQGYTNNNYGGGERDANYPLDSDTEFKIRRFTNGVVGANEVIYKVPYESDYQIAPSGKLMVGRMNRKVTGQAYRVRVLRPNGTTIAPENNDTTGVICMKGEKANMSYDGRFVTFHHYSDGSPQDVGTTAGHSNIFVYDLIKKRSLRVTNMSGDSKAYFPHFRADGWLMFLIKGPTGQPESIAASNASFVLKAMR